MFTCFICRKELNSDKFYTNAARKTGYMACCKICQKAYQKERKLKIKKGIEFKGKSGSRVYNHKPGTKEYKKAAYLKCVYGITLERFNEMLILQEGKCAICKRDFYKEGRNPQVDHNHNTDKVRGLLCWDCNIGLGKFREDYESIENALKYLKLYGFENKLEEKLV